MKIFTVQLSYAAYYFREEVVEAETLDAALDQAVAQANDSPNWSSTDTTGNTFVDAVAEGDHYDLWADNVRQLPIPSRFAEEGLPPLVIVTIAQDGSLDVKILGKPARVEVHNYDVGDLAEPSDLPGVQKDADGDFYTRQLFPPDPADELSSS
jgi:hypothetical protein